MQRWHYRCLEQQRFLLLVMFMLNPGNTTDGCTTVTKKDKLSPVEQLLAEVNEAESQMENDAIILPKTPVEPVQVIVPEGLGFIMTKPAVKPASEDGMPETRLGTMANFSCSRQRLGADDSDTTILWRHHNAYIYTNATVPLSPASFFYSYSTVGQHSILFVHNVSADAAGAVQCFQQCDAGWCLVRAFKLRPEPRACDVFYGSLQNVTSQCGGQISLACRVRMNCTCGIVEEKGRHYSWKLDDSFVGMPGNHGYLEKLGQYQAIRQMQLRREPFPPGTKAIRICAACVRSAETGEVFYEEVLTITPQWPSWWIDGWCPSPSPHRVQCWFRPYSTGRRWVVQAAYAHF